MSCDVESYVQEDAVMLLSRVVFVDSHGEPIQVFGEFYYPLHPMQPRYFGCELGIEYFFKCLCAEVFQYFRGGFLSEFLVFYQVVDFLVEFFKPRALYNVGVTS
jgi:hypothetical protein